MGLKVIFVTAIMFGFAAYMKRLKWAPLKSRKIVSDVIN